MPLYAMRRWLTILCWVLLGGFSAQAETIDAAYARWEALRAPDAARLRFAEGVTFLHDHPGWPEEKTIRLRTEAAALLERPERAAMASFCTDFPPISGRGMVACARSGVGDAAAQQAAVQRAWQQGDFNEDEEERLIEAYGNQFSARAHEARLERLLDEKKTTAAKRMLARVPAAARREASMRIALIEQKPGAAKMLDHLSHAEQRSEGILFERIRWRAAHDDEEHLAELFELAPREVRAPERWWPYRAIAVREEMGQHRYARALRILADHGALKGEALAEALWLKGWLRLQNKQDAQAGYKDFYALYGSVSTPVSKARAAYWAGRAAEKNGNHDIAVEWMQKAARYPTVFYGQLAHLWLHPGVPLALPPAPRITRETQARIARHELARVAEVREKAGDHAGRDAFLSALAVALDNDEELAALAVFANQLKDVAGGVEIAKLALKQGVLLVEAGWPRITLPEALSIEPALALAITRQESQFDPRARSPAGARGMMQLMPATARDLAKKLGLRWSDAALDDPAMNIALGSYYLGRLIRGFDRSYILGIASYNAGASPVRAWRHRMGPPPASLEAAIDWIESIPYAETRTYVMRVLENLTLYRALQAPDAPPTLDKDLLR